jgi:hypothetical protein
MYYLRSKNISFRDQSIKSGILFDVVLGFCWFKQKQSVCFFFFSGKHLNPFRKKKLEYISDRDNV